MSINNSNSNSNSNSNDAHNAHPKECTVRGASPDDIETGAQQTDAQFNLDEYLPQDMYEIWSDVVPQPQPIDVKNRHLIEVTKPFGVNTGSSLRHPCHNLKGPVVCPK